MPRSALWIALRMVLRKGKGFYSGASAVALFGIILGVASLFVAMAVISGFETTLQKSVADMSGHVQIMGMSGNNPNWEGLTEKIKSISPQVVASTRFVMIEGVLAHKGKLSGVILEGLDPEASLQVLQLSQRLIEGSYLSPLTDIPGVLIGKGIARDFSIKVGDQIKVVIPSVEELDPSSFRRRVGKFVVNGILDLGKYEYDQRMMITDLKSAQAVAGIGDRYSGLLLRLTDIDLARAVGQEIGQKLGIDYRVRDWKDANENLFEAIRIERIAIFFVVFVILIAAAFNIASSLYISVVQRYPDIGILKALGFSPKTLLRIFSIEGLLVGAVGSVLGIVLGLLVCWALAWLESHFHILPGSIYKLDRIDMNVRWVDVLAILVSTLAITFAATLAPAKKGASLSPIEGLRNE